MGPLGMDEPGTYEISDGDKKTTVEADRLDYDPEGSLRAWKGATVVATFRWWSSIIKKESK